MTPSAASAAPPSGTSGVRARRRNRTSVPVAYDFRRPIQLSREHSRILQLGFDSFARQATTVFTSWLRTVCSVQLLSIQQLSYDEYIDSLHAPTYMIKLTAEPMNGLGMLELPLPGAMACIDHMLGGPGGPAQPVRPLTEIESGVIRGLTDRLLSEMRYGLAAIADFELLPAGIEYSPQFAQIAGAADVMVVVELEVRIGEGVHKMTLCLPFNGLLPHLTKAAAPAPVSEREQVKRQEAASLLQRRFADVPVEASVRLRPTSLHPAALGQLKPGDVIRLAHPASAPLDVCVDDTTFAHATAGAKGPRLAALIVGNPKENA
ncbi:flagellar motor switch protein FliM [Nocardioides campestrisoli]|uniref:flagellar motor switch protein FliM n=1 Tax=Nocardioides campestrisoli TaxID=2736757 RepID=UPI001CD6377A|nr:flagellar motor switch protein FliM [Nocardioides campestrisoli]